MVDEELTLERAAERLLEDERLRSGLTDDEAKALLDWALAALEAAATRGRPLAAELARIRAIAREVADLVSARDSLDRRAFAARLRALAGLPEPGAAAFWRRWLGRGDAVDDLVERLPGLDGPALVRSVLRLVPPAAREAAP